MKGNALEKGNSIVLLLDVICIIVSYIFTGSLRNGILDGGFFLSLYGTALAIILVYYIITFDFRESNQENICKRGFCKEFTAVTTSHLPIGLVLMGYLFITKQSTEYSRFFFVIFLVVNILLTYLERCYLKLFMLLGYKKSQASSKVMVITLSDRASYVLKKMKKEYEWSIQVNSLAILDKDMTGSIIEGIEVKANQENLLYIIKDLVVDEVFIHLPYECQLNLQDIILVLERMGIIVHIYIDIYNNVNIKEKIIEDYIGFPVITFATQLVDARKLLLKRVIDLTGGFFGIILLGIVTILVAPAIKLESKGPIFFSQTRVGKNGRKFKIYKFRSMYEDAELRKKELLEQNEMSGLMFKMDKDPRITKVGSFLRKTSIDEFPQFINVIKGEMSLVGTRPPTIDEYERYENLHRRRLSIKPGITGLWQTSGRSQITNFEDVVQLDLQYIDHWSIFLDVKLIMKTLFVVVFRVGAK